MPAVEESGPMYLDEDPDAPAAEIPELPETPVRAEPPRVQAPPRAPAPVRAWPEAPVAVREEHRPEPAPQAAAPKAVPAPWARQVQELARTRPPGEGAPTPWKPPAADPFPAAAQDRARPAPLGKRLAARVVDSLVLGAVAAVAAVPLGSAAYDHIQQKTDVARQSGETVTVWLIDGTTGVQLAFVAAVVVVSGLLYEVLPTAKWGRTLGKKLLGLKVLDIESQGGPGFRAALRRWLTHTVLDALAIGFVGLAWCLFDRPWRQCWHDKVARTFVAAD
jgi:uncharacterized RDD family membrane protein YckC